MIKALKKLCDKLIEIFWGYNNQYSCLRSRLSYAFIGGVAECKEFEINNKDLAENKLYQQYGNTSEHPNKRASVYYKEINRTEYYRLQKERRIFAEQRRQEREKERNERVAKEKIKIIHFEEKTGMSIADYQHERIVQYEKELRIKEEEEQKRIEEARRKEELRKLAEEKVALKREQEEIEREEERRKKFAEQKKQERERLEEKQKHINSIRESFKQNYFTSKILWFERSSHLVDEKEFRDMAADFVIQWFHDKGWAEPDREQALCISEVWDNVQVIARAGSGKTTTAVNRCVFLIEHCKISPNQILLLAFNRKAAQEITDRFEEKLGSKDTQAMTFHALAYAVVHPQETLIFDSEDNGLKKSATVQQIIDSYIHDPEWLKIIRSVMIKYFRSSWDEIENKGFNLNPEEMIKHRRSLSYLGLDGNYYKSKAEKMIADFLFERDVPYTYEKNVFWDGRNYRPDFTISSQGKYKGIIIEYFGLAGDPEYDLAIKAKRVFWNKRQDYKFIEMYPSKGPLDEEEIDHVIGKEISGVFGYELCKISEEELWYRIKDRVVDEFSKTVGQFIGLCRLKKISPDDLLSSLNEIRKQAQTSYSKNRNKLEIQFEFVQIARKIYQEYLSSMIMNNEEDFEGLLLEATKKITYGQGSWKRKEGEGNLADIRYLFIDEYQDFSKLFYEMVMAIRNTNATLKMFCVGDDWQAINGFAGSDLKYFKEFLSCFPDSKRLTISRNYRSATKIVNLGNELMKGKGNPAVAVRKEFGEANIVWIDDFMPNVIEEQRYKGDIITPILIRLVNSYVLNGQRVALLCRRRNGTPWYTPYSNIKGLFLENLLNEIRTSLPSDQRSMVVDMNTVHSYKGKEEDAIIVVDAVNRSYPLLHPNHIFFETIGQTEEEIILEEERLLYVALTRARKSVTVVSEKSEISPSISKMIRSFNVVRINELPLPPGEGTEYIVYVSNNLNPAGGGTYEIREYLQAHKYRWNSNKESWVKCCSAKGFDIEKLLKESWVNKARNIFITVRDEFNKTKYQIEIDSNRGINNRYPNKE